MIRTGVIVGVPLEGVTVSGAIAIREQLAERFPEVRFAVVPGVSSVAFQWDDPDPAYTPERIPDEAYVSP